MTFEGQTFGYILWILDYKNRMGRFEGIPTVNKYELDILYIYVHVRNI